MTEPDVVARDANLELRFERAETRLIGIGCNDLVSGNGGRADQATDERTRHVAGANESNRVFD